MLEEYQLCASASNDKLSEQVQARSSNASKSTLLDFNCAICLCSLGTESQTRDGTTNTIAENATAAASEKFGILQCGHMMHTECLM